MSIIKRIFKKTIYIQCSVCGTGIQVSVPRGGHTTAQIRCPSCRTWIGVSVVDGDYFTFERAATQPGINMRRRRENPRTVRERQ